MRDFFKVWSEDNMNQEFIEGYCDVHGQAIENVRYNLLKYLNEHNKLTVEDVNNICNSCSKIDEGYLHQ